MAEICVDCGKDVGTFGGLSRLIEGVNCYECHERRNPPVQRCPKCRQYMVKEYAGRIHGGGYPPKFNFKWTCSCGHTEHDCDSLKNRYAKQLREYINSYSDWIKIFNDEVEDFFNGILPSSQFIKNKGKVRIVDHGTIETLQVEPIDGGQYEIAVRVPFPEGYLEKDKHNPECPYMGYQARMGHIWGVNTGGH